MAPLSLVRDFGHDWSVARLKRHVGGVQEDRRRQDLVLEGGLLVRNIAREDSSADLMTNNMGSDHLSACIARLRCWPRDGWARAAPRCEAADARAVVVPHYSCAVAGAARRGPARRAREAMHRITSMRYEFVHTMHLHVFIRTLCCVAVACLWVCGGTAGTRGRRGAKYARPRSLSKVGPDACVLHVDAVRLAVCVCECV